MEAIPDAKNPLKREKEGFENAPGLYLKKTLSGASKHLSLSSKQKLKSPKTPISRHIGLRWHPGRPEPTLAYPNVWENLLGGPFGAFRAVFGAPLGPGPLGGRDSGRLIVALESSRGFASATHLGH